MVIPYLHPGMHSKVAKVGFTHQKIMNFTSV